MHCCRNEIQSCLSWNRKLWRVACPCTFLGPPPLSLTGTCHFYCRRTPAGREAGIRSTRLGSVSIAPRRVFRARDTRHAGLGNHVSRYPSPSVEWRASRYIKPNRLKVDGVSRSTGTDQRAIGTKPCAPLSRCVVIESIILVNRVPKVPGEKEQRDVTARRADVRAFVESLTSREKREVSPERIFTQIRHALGNLRM